MHLLVLLFVVNLCSSSPTVFDANWRTPPYTARGTLEPFAIFSNTEVNEHEDVLAVMDIFASYGVKHPPVITEISDLLDNWNPNTTVLFVPGVFARGAAVALFEAILDMKSVEWSGDRKINILQPKTGFDVTFVEQFPVVVTLASIDDGGDHDWGLCMSPFCAVENTGLSAIRRIGNLPVIMADFDSPKQVPVKLALEKVVFDPVRDVHEALWAFVFGDGELFFMSHPDRFNMRALKATTRDRSVIVEPTASKRLVVLGRNVPEELEILLLSTHDVFGVNVDLQIEVIEHEWEFYSVFAKWDQNNYLEFVKQQSHTKTQPNPWAARMPWNSPTRRPLPSQVFRDDIASSSSSDSDVATPTGWDSDWSFSTHDGLDNDDRWDDWITTPQKSAEHDTKQTPALPEDDHNKLIASKIPTNKDHSLGHRRVTSSAPIQDTTATSKEENSVKPSASKPVKPQSNSPETTSERNESQSVSREEELVPPLNVSNVDRVAAVVPSESEGDSQPRFVAMKEQPQQEKKGIAPWLIAVQILIGVLISVVCGLGIYKMATRKPVTSFHFDQAVSTESGITSSDICETVPHNINQTVEVTVVSDDETEVF